MSTKKSIKKISKKVKSLSKKEEVLFLRNLYKDFKGMLEEGLGDMGGIIKKHKVLLFISFIAYLLFRNKQFSIEGFVNELEKRIKKDKEW